MLVFGTGGLGANVAQQNQKQNANLTIITKLRAMGTQTGETISLSFSHLKGGILPTRGTESLHITYEQLILPVAVLS